MHLVDQHAPTSRQDPELNSGPPGAWWPNRPRPMPRKRAIWIFVITQNCTKIWWLRSRASRWKQKMLLRKMKQQVSHQVYVQVSFDSWCCQHQQPSFPVDSSQPASQPSEHYTSSLPAAPPPQQNMDASTGQSTPHQVPLITPASSTTQYSVLQKTVTLLVCITVSCISVWIKISNNIAKLHKKIVYRKSHCTKMLENHKIGVR